MEDVRKREAWARVENQELRERIKKQEPRDDGSVATSRVSKASTRAQAALEEMRRKLEVAEQVRVGQVELTIVEMIMKDNTNGFLRRKKHLDNGGKLTAEFRASEENILEENVQRYLSVLRPIRLDPKPEDLEEIYQKHKSPPTFTTY